MIVVVGVGVVVVLKVGEVVETRRSSFNPDTSSLFESLIHRNVLLLIQDAHNIMYLVSNPSSSFTHVINLSSSEFARRFLICESHEEDKLITCVKEEEGLETKYMILWAS